MTETTADNRLVDVRIVGMPLDIMARAQEHGDGMNREFALIAADRSPSNVPGRLLELSQRLREQYSGYTEQTQQLIDEALRRGETVIDVEFRVPASAAQASLELGAMLDEADQFCRQGELLTLATPPDLVRFRRWYLDEFVRQINGEPPTPWSEYTGG